MTKAMLVGVGVALILRVTEVSLGELTSECCLDPDGGMPTWYALFAPPLGAVVSLLPGFIAGWLSQSRGIIAGLLVGLFGDIVYSAIFLTMWSTVLEAGPVALAEMTVRFVALASSWALIGAAAGGTAQLLRSGEVPPGDARDVQTTAH